MPVLLAEDSVADAGLVVRELRRAGFASEPVRADPEAGFLVQLQEEFDVILSDYDMPQFSGIRALELFQEQALEIPFIIISGTIGEGIAVQVMRLGASDYLLKDRLTRLGPAIKNALEQAGTPEPFAGGASAAGECGVHRRCAQLADRRSGGDEREQRDHRDERSLEPVLAGQRRVGLLGQNYLAICDRGTPRFAPADGPVATAGIRSVLDGSVATFRLEYACHTLAMERWFAMGVSPGQHCRDRLRPGYAR